MALRSIVLGTVDFTASVLQKLVAIGQAPMAVLTRLTPGRHSDFFDLEPYCLEHNIPLLKNDRANSPEALAWMKGFDPDIIFCSGWSEILKKSFLELPKIGVVGYHPALIPENRGRHPIIWALVLGLKETGSTFFMMDEGADTGDILSQERIPVSLKDDADSLYSKIKVTACRQLEILVPLLESGEFLRLAQDHSKANFWRTRTAIDGKIDFRMSGMSVYNLVRALTRPYPGAHIEKKGLEAKVWKVSLPLEAPANIEPGKVIEADGNRILIKCGDSAVYLEDHEIYPIPKVGDYF